MLAKKDVAILYIDYLEKGNTIALLSLFETNAKITSPIYGIKSAKQFYTDLAKDTNSNHLTVKGVFEDSTANQLALYFNFKWVLANNTVVSFDVVDILEFNSKHKITALNIIYDSTIAKQLVANL